MTEQTQDQKQSQDQEQTQPLPTTEATETPVRTIEPVYLVLEPADFEEASRLGRFYSMMWDIAKDPSIGKAGTRVGFVAVEQETPEGETSYTPYAEVYNIDPVAHEKLQRVMGFFAPKLDGYTVNKPVAVATEEQTEAYLMAAFEVVQSIGAFAGTKLRLNRKEQKLTAIFSTKAHAEGLIIALENGSVDKIAAGGEEATVAREQVKTMWQSYCSAGLAPKA